MTVAATGVTRTFQHDNGPVEVLRGVDLSVSSGEFVTVSGRSGSGKSALFSILCGFDQPDSGTVLICDEPVVAPPPWQRCAVLPQALGLAGELTVAENVALPLRLGRPRPAEAAVADRVADLLGRLGIGQLGDRYPNEISYGQQQRAALARALSGKPAVLLADEPTAHLDHDSIGPVLRLLRDAASEGSAVLVATHHDEVHERADRTLALAAGRIVA
jgi:putative ABC transport system ATP-binding protein